MTVSITRSEHTPADLRRKAGRTADARASRRMLALALVMEGESRETAARQCGMERTLRDWVHRYNAMGAAPAPAAAAAVARNLMRHAAVAQRQLAPAAAAADQAGEQRLAVLGRDRCRLLGMLLETIVRIVSNLSQLT